MPTRGKYRPLNCSRAAATSIARTRTRKKTSRIYHRSSSLRVFSTESRESSQPSGKSNLCLRSVPVTSRNNWPSVRLGDVLKQRKEFITIVDTAIYRRPRVQLHARGIVLRDEVPGALIKTKSQQICRDGEFLVAEIDAKVGGYGIVPGTLDGSIVSSHYFLFVIDESRLDRRFFNWFIRTPHFRDQVEAQGSTNYAAIRPSHVLSYVVSLPGLVEQRRIVARIEELAARISEAIRLRGQAAEESEATLTATLRTTFAECPGAIVPLEDVCSALFDNLHSNPRYADSGVACVRSPDVGHGTLNLENARRTDEDEYRRRTVRAEPRGQRHRVRQGRRWDG